MLKSFGRLSMLFLVFVSCRSVVGVQHCDDFRIVRRPITFDSTRSRLSLEYMSTHYGIDKNHPTIHPQMVVVHWTDIPSIEATFDAFNPVKLPGSRKKISSAGALNVSAHYMVDRDGTVYRLLPDTIFARHVIGLNHCAIGIENIGSQSMPLTKKQLQANVCLIQTLRRKYPIQYVLGHHEYTRFIGHPLWLEKDPNYLTQKIDPGDAFMQSLRKALAPLHFKPLPPLNPSVHPAIDEIPKN